MPTQDPSLNRRALLAGGATAAGLIPLGRAADAETVPSSPEARATGSSPEAGVIDEVTLTVNGMAHRLSLDPRTTLLDALRGHLGLTGSKKGCDHGQCGACTVQIDGRTALSCLTFAAAVRGKVTTIEGLAKPDGTLHPVQQAFIDQDAFQCGYCTPGQIMSSLACIQGGHAHDEGSIREFMSGNLCRCAAYPHIVAAVQQAAHAMEG